MDICIVSILVLWSYIVTLPSEFDKDKDILFQSLFWWILYCDCLLKIWLGLRGEKFQSCFGGSYIVTIELSGGLEERRFNPCFGGSYIVTILTVSFSYNICFNLVLVDLILDDYKELAEFKWDVFQSLFCDLILWLVANLSNRKVVPCFNLFWWILYCVFNTEMIFTLNYVSILVLVDLILWHGWKGKWLVQWFQSLFWWILYWLCIKYIDTKPGFNPCFGDLILWHTRRKQKYETLGFNPCLVDLMLWLGQKLWFNESYSVSILVLVDLIFDRVTLMRWCRHQFQSLFWWIFIVT